jgi:hypothetical protein
MIDEGGKRYGSLRVIKVVKRSLAERFKRSKAKWLCVCDCGMRTEVFGDKLRSGHISRCLRCEREMRSKPVDTLVKRLRKEQQWGDTLDGEAADRIETLDRALDDIIEYMPRSDWHNLKPETQKLLEIKSDDQ